MQLPKQAAPDAALTQRRRRRSHIREAFAGCGLLSATMGFLLVACGIIVNTCMETLRTFFMGIILIIGGGLLIFLGLLSLWDPLLVARGPRTKAAEAPAQDAPGGLLAAEGLPSLEIQSVDS